MALEVIDTSDWTLERILPFVGDVISQFQRLSDRFPDDTSPAWLWNEWISGRRKLWLVLEDGAFKACALTHINVMQSSGKKEAVLLDLAGPGIAEYADELNRALEDWARREGADFCSVIGRRGWERMLKSYGYRTQTVVYRKDMGNGIVQPNEV